MFGLFKTLFNSAPRQTGQHDEAAILSAIEDVVDGTDPRLRLVSNYKRKLRKSVRYSLEYVNEVVEQVPSPIDVNTRAFGTNPYVHAFFGSAEQVQNVFSLSKTLNHFYKRPENKELSDIYALLAMEKQEKTVLGMELQGEVIKKDVSQVVVNFSGHVLITPSATVTGTKQELRERAFEDLVACALARIVSFRSRRKELERQRGLLQMKLRTFKAGKRGLESLIEADNAEQNKVEEAERQLMAIEQQLREATADLSTLDDYLAQVKQVLRRPQDYLRVNTVSMRLNRMGVKIDTGSSQRGDDITLTEVGIGDTRQFVVALVRYPRDEMLPREHYFAKLRPYLA